MTTLEEMEDRLGFHPATEVTKNLHIRVREEYLNLVEGLLQFLPEGREKSLCLTSLQESCMWANAAVAISLAPLVRE